MQKLALNVEEIAKNLSINMVKVGNCKIHPEQDIYLLNGAPTCPRCYLEADTKQLTESVKEKLKQLELLEKYNMLQECSVVNDKTILEANFKSFIPISKEQEADKQEAIEHYNRLLAGSKYNLWLTGNCGIGKSHLAMSILKALNHTKEYTCVFINVVEMLSTIKSSFKDTSSKYTESYFVELLSEIDFLVLDDLGAETGDTDTTKRATDWTSQMLTRIATARQGKATIITTNLTKSEVIQMYDERFVSRTFENFEAIKFKNTKDSRHKKKEMFSHIEF